MSDNSHITKKYLEDVVLLRLLLIFLLIWNHAFAPYSGKWETIPSIENVLEYRWLVLIVYNMRIQALIFISGYLLGYTSLRKSNSLLFKNCIIKKIKRLLIPSILFSTIYYCFFYDLTHPINTIVYTIINGAGHMWFLPMLFWCFVGVYLVEKLKIKPTYVLITSIVFAIIPCPELVLRFNKTIKYFIYFYIGFGIQRGYFEFLNPNNKIWRIILCIVIYLGIFVLNYIVIGDNFVLHIFDSHGIWQNNDILNKVIALMCRNSLLFIMSITGLLGAFYCTHFFVIGKYKLPNWMIELSTFCYGIYICQQFILVFLYYHTSLPVLCGSILLPWIAIIITLILSIIITFLLLKTKFGRFLIG